MYHNVDIKNAIGLSVNATVKEVTMDVVSGMHELTARMAMIIPLSCAGPTVGISPPTGTLGPATMAIASEVIGSATGIVTAEMEVTRKAAHKVSFISFGNIKKL